MSGAAPAHPWPHEATDRVHQLLGEVASKELQCLRLDERLRELTAEVARLQASRLEWVRLARWAERRQMWFEDAYRDLVRDLESNYLNPAGPRKQIDLDAARAKFLGPPQPEESR